VIRRGRPECDCDTCEASLTRTSFIGRSGIHRRARRLGRSQPGLISVRAAGFVRDRERACLGDISTDSAVVWAESPTGLRGHAAGMFDRRKLQDDYSRASSDALPESRFYGEGAVRGSFHPGRIFSTGCGLKISLCPTSQEKTQVGISGPRQPQRFDIVCLVGDTAGQGWASMLPAAACEPTAPCLENARIFSFIPAIISTPIVRSLPN